jgi:hypothetical protein
MGASINIEAHNKQEFDALQSEGAPEMHMSYSSTSELLRAFGLQFDAEYCVGSINPEDILAAAEDARTYAIENGDWLVYEREDGLNEYIPVLQNRVKTLIEMAQMASRLGRTVVYG